MSGCWDSLGLVKVAWPVHPSGESQLSSLKGGSMEERQEKVVMEIREKEALEMVEALAKSLDQSQKMINHLGILMLQLNLIKDRFRPAMNRAGVGLAEEKDDASQAPL